MEQENQTMDNEIVNMINVSENDSEDNNAASPMPEQSVDPAEAETVNSTEPSIDDPISVSDVIVQNPDKHINMIMLKDCIQAVFADVDLVNYIPFIDTSKNIPCIYDCQKLVVPTASVKNADGTWNITSIEGRRSGFIIKCPNRDLVMSKNFIYDIMYDASGKIETAVKYNRKHEVEIITHQATDDYDTAAFLVASVLPKIVKSGKYKTLPELQEQVINSYNSVDDINGLFKIIELRMKIGC